MGRTCDMYWVEDKCVQCCGGECEGRRPLVRHRHRWEDNIKMDLIEIEWKIRYWIHLVEECSQWEVFVSTLMNWAQ
jgi:hypothetical protein